jgi:recombinational DNA repair protein RecR
MESSKLIEKAVEIAQLPGIGKRSALLVLHLLKSQKSKLFFAIAKYEDIKYCTN